MYEGPIFDGEVIQIKVPDIIEADGKIGKYKELYKLLDELSPKTAFQTSSINPNCPIKKIIVDFPKNFKVE